MNKTSSKHQFKKSFGQANHYLITALVGLHDLNIGNRNSAPDNLHTSWNPKNKARSIERSEIFLFNSFLGWAVDGLDMYVSILNRKPKYIQDDELQRKFDGTDRSVRRKVMLLGEYFDIDKITLALLDVLITWRNNSLHFLAENVIDKKFVEILKSNSEAIESKYCGLCAQDLPDKAHSARDLTFKETASLIRVVHDYVNEVDAKVISALDVNAFLSEYIGDTVHNNVNFKQQFKSFTGVRKGVFIKNWIANHLGFELTADQVTYCAKLKA